MADLDKLYSMSGPKVFQETPPREALGKVKILAASILLGAGFIRAV